VRHFNGVVWSIPLGLPMRCKKKKKKKKTLHILTHGIMRGCGLTALVVCINDKIHDIRERNVTIRNEIWSYEHPFPRVSRD
jgi:hypothetical protein